MAKKQILVNHNDEKIKFLQRFFRKVLFCIFLKKKFVNKLNTLQENLAKIMNHIQYCQDLEIIRINIYSNLMNNLYLLAEEYDNFRTIIDGSNIHSFRKKYFIFFKKLKDFEDKLFLVYSNSGSCSLKELFNIHINFNDYFEYQTDKAITLFNLYDNIFKPISFDKYTRNNETINITRNLNVNESVESDNKVIDDKVNIDNNSAKNIDNNKYDLHKISSCISKQKEISIPVSFLSTKTDEEMNADITFISKNVKDYPIFLNKMQILDEQQTQILKLFIPLDKEGNTVFVCKGFFIKDPLNIHRKNLLISTKINKLKDTNDNKLVDINFKNAFIEQLSLKDLVIKSVDELNEKIYIAYNTLKKTKQKTLLTSMKDFSVLDNNQKAEQLTILLINKNDNDSQYLAYLLYDMIADEAIKSTNNNIVYKKLHWTIQKKFKITIDEINSNNNKLMNVSEDDISYEKKIHLMKIDDYVKQKALEKYKEITSKSNDSYSKAQQYLDGLLKIPFNIFRKEKILEYLSIFSFKISIFFQNINEMLLNVENNNNSKNIDNILVNFLKTIILNNDNKNLTDTLIDGILKDLRFNYLNVQIRINKDKLINIIENLNYTNLKKIITLIKKNCNVKNLMLENGETIKLTNKTEKIDIETIINQFTLYINYKHDDLLKNITKEKIVFFEKLLQAFNANTHIEMDTSKILTIYKNLNPMYKTLYTKYSELHNEWEKYQLKKYNYIKNARKCLNDAVFGHDEAKNQIERIIAQWMNGELSGYCFGFEGPPGTGKTSMAKKGLTKCLIDEDGTSRPFSFIAMGGSSNGSTLEGHSYTYVGSTWGKIVDVLMETKCMNPIIFIDELDKISKTEHGKELIGILTHLTDSTQNTEFCDKYFSGIKIDLSKVLFIFSYNAPENIDPILLDRIHRVKFSSLKKPEKIHIAKNYLLKEIYASVGFNRNDIIISDEIIEQIIEEYTFEPGVRKLRERLFEIIREINLRNILNETICKNVIHFPFHLQMEHLENDIFIKKIKISAKKISDKPKIGLVNGLYATNYGLGGITLIESYKIPMGSSSLDLELTGQQGNVMKESMKVAKTVAWNILPNSIKMKIKSEMKSTGNFGLHIHCPEAATPKDGPSAGLAITTTIISLLTGIPVNNKVAMTGEVNLNGLALEIGGLESKLYGAKRAGVKTVLIPHDNEKDLTIIKLDKHNKNLLDDFEIIMVDTIWDILQHALMPNNLNFINYLNVDKNIQEVDDINSVNFM
jgi:endopeptidase La